MTENNLKNKKVLITGINGFVGSHLAETLRPFGADVYGLSRSLSNKKTLKANNKIKVLDNKNNAIKAIKSENDTQKTLKKPFEKKQLNNKMLFYGQAVTTIKTHTIAQNA